MGERNRHQRLPAPLRDTGPRIEYAPRGQVRLVDGKYVETPGTAGPASAGIDDVWETHRGWSRSQENCPEPPSTYYYRQSADAADVNSR